MNDLATKAIEELKALGVTNLTPFEIVELHDLGKAVDVASIDDGYPCGSGVSIAVGGILLHPLTCYAIDWHNHVVQDAKHANQQLAITVYAMAFGRKKGAFEGLYNYDGINLAVRFMNNLPVTAEELSNAVENVFYIAGDESNENNHPHTVDTQNINGDRKKTCRDLTLAFCAFAGVPFDDWYTETPDNVIRAFAMAVSASVAKAGGNIEEASKTYVTKAVRAMRQKIKDIYNARQIPQKT